LIVVVVLVALFGADRLPRMARGLGEGIREFRDAFREGDDPTAPPAGSRPNPMVKVGGRQRAG
jgi:sec-independent protein translocase protein TatA